MEIDRLLNLRYNAFSENEKYVCHYLSGHLHECCAKTIDAFAQDCHVSKTMLVRFAKKLGFSGYSAMKAQIKLDLQERASDIGRLLPEELVQECLKVFHDAGMFCRIETSEGIYTDPQMEELLRVVSPAPQNSELTRMQKEIESGIRMQPYRDYP